MVYKFLKLFFLFESCTVKVKNIQRIVYCLISEDCSSFKEAYSEIDNWMSKNNIPEYGCQPKEEIINPFSNDKSQFNVERSYLLVKYSAKYPPLPTDFNGQFIERCYNTSQGPLEAFLMRKKVKGNCYLKIQNPEVYHGAKFSWCQHEIISDYNDIKVDSETLTVPPKLTVVTVKVLSVKKDVKTDENEIIGICGFVSANYDIENPPKNGRFENAGEVFTGKFYGICKPSQRNVWKNIYK